VLAPRLGLIAEGGFVLTVDSVTEFELEVTVELEVALVTIGSAALTTVGITNVIQNIATIPNAITLLIRLEDIMV
jgi:hypothetical protein